MRRYTHRVITFAGLLALSASAVLAQNPPAPPRPEGPRAKGRAGRRGRGRLNLSDAQREHLRQIESRYGAGLRARREEMRALRQSGRQGGATLTAEQEARARQLREELRADAEKMRAEMRAVLTDDQRAQLQSVRDEMRQQRELRRERRQELREQRRLRRQQRRAAPPGTTDQF